MTYSVKQISEILDVDQETVRRWIRSKKLRAEIDSRKEGNKVSDEELKRFLETTPKYLAKLSFGLAAFAPTVAPVVGLATYAGGLAAGAVMTYLAEKKKQDVCVQSEDLLKFLKENIDRLSSTIFQKQALIEQTKVEIEGLQEQIRQYQQLVDNREMLDEAVSNANRSNNGTEG